jgi:hypothetical protein
MRTVRTMGTQCIICVATCTLCTTVCRNASGQLSLQYGRRSCHKKIITNVLLVFFVNKGLESQTNSKIASN